MKRWARRAGALLFSFALAGLLLEGFARARFHPIRFYGTTYIPVDPDPIVRFRPRPGWSGPMENLDYSVPVTIGPDGLRAVPQEDAPGAPEVLFFGDSFMFGDGLDDASTIPSATARIARAQGHPIRATNAGVLGWGTLQSYLLATGPLADRSFDTVVLGVCLENDALDDLAFSKDRFRVDDETIAWNGIPAPPPAAAEAGGVKGILRKSRFYLATATLLRARAPSLRTLLGRRGDDHAQTLDLRAKVCRVPPDSETARAWGVLGAVVRHWDLHARDRGGRLVIAALPSAWMLDEASFAKGRAAWPPGEYRRDAPRERLRAIAQARGVLFVEPWIDQKNFYPFDGHPTPAGATQIAEEIVRRAL